MSGNPRFLTVHILGDSIAASYPEAAAPLTGWGQVLHTLVDASVCVLNHARPRLNTERFFAAGCAASALSMCTPGDMALLAFGSGADAPIVSLVRALLDAGVTPVLLTPFPACAYGPDGQLLNTHAPFAQRIHEIARQENVLVFDLAQSAWRVLSAMSPHEVRALYLHVPPRRYAAFEHGACDGMHTCFAGAYLICLLLREGLTETPLGAHFLPRVGKTL